MSKVQGRKIMRIKRMSLFIAILLLVFSIPATPAYAQQSTPNDPAASTLDPAASIPDPEASTPDPAASNPDPAANTPNLVQPLANPCASSTPSSGKYTVTLCFTAPNSGSTVSGPVTVAVSASVSGTNPGIQRIVFYINTPYLLTDFQSPYTFVLPSMKWQDGSYTLGVEAVMRYTTANRATINLTFSNGNAQPPVNLNTFTPTSGTTPPNGSPFIVTAGGDGADGATNASKITHLISTINPNLFLYLGDVYEKGSVTEFYNWYGTSGTNFSNFLSITDPTIGNHEYSGSSGGAGYFDYWNNIPNYYSFSAGGWHFVSLNSNSSKIGVSKTSAQYAWLSQDLTANSSMCTIVYYHHPLFNIGPEGSTTAMADIWALMAQDGVSIVLNGHDHDYQRWVPLDANGNPSATGITEFVAGGAGHGLQTISRTDSRVAFSDYANPGAFGVLELGLNSSGASFSYINTSGTILDSGVIPCNKSGAGADTQAPSVPTGLTATAVSSTKVNLAWQAATDNVAVAGYTIYRNSAVLTTVSGTTLTYSDANASPSTTYSYTVDAFDAAGNHSAQSSPASVTTPSSADTQAPSVPSGLTATAANATQVNLAWKASTDNVGVTGYTIYRNSAVLTTVSGTTLTYSDATVSPSTTYSYTVDAFDAAGNHSAQSSTASVTTPASADTQAPSVPTGLTATATSATQVNLAWQASTDNVSVTGYTIYRNGAVLTTVSGSTLTYSDATASPTTTYSYTVDAFDAAGNHSAQSAPASVTTPALPSSLTFSVGADTYVNSGSPTSNYGTSTVWRVDGSPILNGYLRFTVQGLNGHTVQHAYLHVYANSSASAGIDALKVADNTWGETTINYNNAPAFGALLGASGAFGAGSWITIDVTSYVTGEGTYSFGIMTPGATQISLAAKESGVNAAYLVVNIQ
jgi:chitodextrinase